jgi:hypothetical protein
VSRIEHQNKDPEVAFFSDALKEYLARHTPDSVTEPETTDFGA